MSEPIVIVVGEGANSFRVTFNRPPALTAKAFFSEARRIQRSRTYKK